MLRTADQWFNIYVSTKKKIRHHLRKINFDKFFTLYCCRFAPSGRSALNQFVEFINLRFVLLKNKQAYTHSHLRIHISPEYVCIFVFFVVNGRLNICISNLTFCFSRLYEVKSFLTIANYQFHSLVETKTNRMSFQVFLE